MARKRRRKYTLEFKQEAVRLVQKQGLSVAHPRRPDGLFFQTVGDLLIVIGVGVAPLGATAAPTYHAPPGPP